MSTQPRSLDAQQTNDAAIWRERFAASGKYIAPTWPLDQFIAVNPWWEMRHWPIAEVAARMAALGKIKLLAPEALLHGAQSLPLETDVLPADGANAGHWLNISDLIDQRRDLQHRMSWHDEIVEQISRFAARYFAAEDAVAEDPQALYTAWLDALRHDKGISVLMAEPEIGGQFLMLPEDIDTLFLMLAEEADIDSEVAGDYAHALLLDIKGWAAWVAYLRWQSQLAGRTNDLMTGLLAIRAAWELLLWRHTRECDPTLAQQVLFQWRGQQGALRRVIDAHLESQRHDWALQCTAEKAYQTQLAGGLLTATDECREERPLLQAAFCIDVRSEAFRRRLESQHQGIQTIGFAGFFGLPIDFRAAGSTLKRPQLPGLLMPALSVQQGGDAKVAAQYYQRDAGWLALSESAPGMFGLVEAAGIAYAWQLLKNGFFSKTAPRHDTAQLVLTDETGPLSVAAKTELAATILQAMGLTGRLAPTVLLAGHGSSNCNNPHAASLDCGACGGQSGEINVRVLAALLNDAEVRAGLNSRGLALDSDTTFIPALHDTTTDEIHLLDGQSCPGQVTEWLLASAKGARRNRYHAAAHVSDESLAAGAAKRAADWSEIRPEWGLAGNAAFVAAPRARTRHLDLAGRVFLHDYDASADDGSLLELILTAPVVVANWINMQYNASVADNLHYGSGSKTLHNVVGGRLGVIEGQGGDLRIGLPIQSVHDGERWMHTPLRLSVYIEASREAIDEVYDKHQTVRELVDNEWLYLFQIDAAGIYRKMKGEWQLAHSAS